MRHVSLTSASAIVLLAACSTPGTNTGQSPAPGDSTVATTAGTTRPDTVRRDGTQRDSAAARNRTDSTAANRQQRDSAMGSGRPADSTGGSTATSATVSMKTASGADAGTLTVSDAGRSIAISGTLRGLPPGTHGIHLHMVGTCTAPAFTSAGEHWNPTGRQHGEENPQGPHLGDLRNITVKADGSADVQVSVSNASLKGTSALLDSDGASIVVHAAADDYRTDPSGNSGARIACGAVAPK